jgi:hypothetical protein
MTRYPYYIETPNGRVHFTDIKDANQYAQSLANIEQRLIVRYDVDGGQSWFRPESK